MRKLKRAGMLIILLAFPALFFIFLKTCGTNHYDLPYFHPVVEPSGEVSLKGQDTVYYQVSGVIGLGVADDTILSKVLDNKVNVFFGVDPNAEKNTRWEIHQNRLIEKLSNETDVAYYERYSNTSNDFEFNPVITYVQEIEGESTNWESIFKLNETSANGRTFLLHQTLILVDGQRRIRGYYNLADSDELDRALAEIKILLYQRKIAGKN